MESIKMLTYSFPEFESIEIHGLSDIHVGSPQFEKKKLEKYLVEKMGKPNSFLVLAGDLIDNGLKGSKTNVYRQTMSPDDQIDLVGSILEPYADRILCIVDGNHERRSIIEADISPSRILAYRLGLSDKYERIMAFMKVSVGKRRSGSCRRPIYTIAVHHGALGNKHSINAYAISCGADLFITGHTHRPGIEPLVRYDLDTHNGYASLKPVKVMTTTSWCRYGDYGAEKMLKPSGIFPNWAELYGGEHYTEVTQS